MEAIDRTSLAAGALEHCFDVLNKQYFGGLLDAPIITIQSAPKTYGHVTISKVWRSGNELRHELNMGAETLDRYIPNTIATLLHEMVHLWNIRESIQDCSRGNRYHNKHFRDAAISRDLDISYHSSIGWSITKPTPNLCDFIAEQGWDDIDMARAEPTSHRSKGQKSSTRKYVCSNGCGQNVRSTKEARLICADCNVPFVLAK